MLNKYIIIFLSLITYAQYLYSESNYYVLHEGKKQFLYPDESKLIMKFDHKQNDNMVKMQLNALLKDNIKTYNEFKEDYVIIELKKNSDSGQLKALRELNNVIYADYGYTKGDKVVHYPTDELIVKYKSSYGKLAQDNLNKLFKTNVIEKVSFFTDLYLLSYINNGEDGKDNIFDVANKYAATGLVEFAQPNFIRANMLLYMPNDSLIDSMWHVKNTGTNIPNNVQGTPDCDLNLDSAWNITIGNPNVLIAIIDTGCDTGHVDLKPNFCEKSLWYDAYDNDSIPMDEYSHGTPMAGIAAAAGNNEIGTAGVAFGCKIMPVRVFGPWPTAYTTDLILGKGLQWAWQHGASVLSNSWGGGIPTSVVTNAILNAKKYGRNTRGSVVVAGSGNDDNDSVYYPASYPGVIGVGGISPCNQRKSPTSCDLENWGANYGEGLDVVAPIPFIGAPLVLGGWCICATGTSSATPQVSGIAGLLVSKNINISGDSVNMAIERTAQRVGNYSYNVIKENGAWNFEMGYGRPDAKKALDFIPAGPSFISDLVPPVISMVPPESHLFTTSVDVNADITDNIGIPTDINAPRLYYSKTLNPAEGYIIGANTGSGQYKFSLPVLALGERMYYYVAAQDISASPNVVTYPFGGKGYNPPGNTAPQKKLFLTNSSSYQQSFNSLNSPIIIPTYNETTIVAGINCPVNKTILDVDCRIDITHEYDEDLIVTLTSPAGTEIMLTANQGKEGDNYANTIFDDEAVLDIQDTNNLPPYTGNFKPVEKLWLLDGENSGGEWKLTVIDYGQPSGGVFNNWSLIFRYADNTIASIPDRFELLGNFPNPFNPITTIKYNVKERSRVRIVLYNSAGQQSAVVLDEIQEPGFNLQTTFNATQLNGGMGIASGIYFYTMFADNRYIASRKMVLVK